MFNSQAYEITLTQPALILTLGVRRSFTIQIVHCLPKFGPILLYRENEN